MIIAKDSLEIKRKIIKPEARLIILPQIILP